MRTNGTAAHRAAPRFELVTDRFEIDRSEPERLKSTIANWLDDAKAEDIVEIDLKGKSSIGDYMLIASGNSHRHVGAIAQRVADELKKAGHRGARVEGVPQCDWVLIDVGDVIVHVFRPEVREFYNLEKMWSGDRPAPESHGA
jgi:ribosome-associated protein